MMKRVATVLCTLLAPFAVGCGGPAEGEEEALGMATLPLQTLEYNEAVEGVPGSLLGGADPYVVMSNTAWGWSAFVKDGDKIRVRDEESDGMSVAVYWTTPDRHGICRTKLGQGVNAFCNKDFPEDQTVTFYLGRCDQTATRTCQRYGDYNWVDWAMTVNTGN